MTQAFNLALFANKLNTSGQTDNTGLQNSSVTVTAGTGMSGGGAVALGSSVTLTNAGVTSVTAGTGIAVSASTGAVTISSTVSGNGGGEIISSATDVTLTTSSKKVQQIEMTAANKAVILPSTAGYTASTIGTPIFTITNAGSNSFDIENSDGFTVFGLAVGASCTISLAGNTTQNQWVGQSVNNSVVTQYRGSINTISTTTPSFTANNCNMQVAALSSTLIVAVWLNSTTKHTYAAAGTIGAGGLITWGTPTAISIVRAYSKVNITSFNFYYCNIIL